MRCGLLKGAAEMTVGGGHAARIASIYISDFRAFPALAPASIILDGKNLLVWGENGSGKSSIYRALRGLFSVTVQDILPMQNVFSDPAEPSVKATLTDKTELHWSAAGHPTANVLDTSRKSAFLSHTRLLEMNRGSSANDAPNLFAVAVEKLLADFEATVSGGVRRTVGELWKDVNEALERRVPHGGRTRRSPDFVAKVKEACARFNEGMKQALDALEVHAKSLTRKLLDVFQQDALDLVGFIFFDVIYDEEARELRNQKLIANVKFRSYPLPTPPNFLNEARLSALAIATYLAGRLACVPASDKALKLLVLDDPLISLDYSHRRPVLEVIGELFKGWQIILLTHDRFWFELAREQLASEPWKAIEIYEKLDSDGLLRPVIWESQEDLVAETLKQAGRFLDDNHPAAAANYARTACELTLRRYCRNHNVSFGYTDDPQRIKIDDLLNKGAKQAEGNADREAAFKGLKRYKKLILNPLSHNPTQPIVKADVAAAIEAVRLLVAACRKQAS
jgi:energy-coupling factor transporter ATP-binding protein EcfA2